MPGRGWKAVPEWVFRLVPAVASLREYSWAAFRGDLAAGLTVAAIAIPQAMAYAILAGLPPQYGLYTAIVMTAVGAVFDSSKLLINGPTNAISIALLSALALVPQHERLQAAILIAFLVGCAQVGIALLRLGDLTRYVSHSVIIGFTLGAATLLLFDQGKNLVSASSGPSHGPHSISRSFLALVEAGIHWPTLFLGIGTIAIVLLVRRFNKALRRWGVSLFIPQHLLAVIVMAGLVYSLRLDESLGVRVAGSVPAELPSFAWPFLSIERIRLLADNAFAIAILGLLEAIAMAKAIAARTGQKLDINQQCLSEGAANLAGSFFQCMPGSGSLTRSAVNEQAGAHTQWSGVVSAVGVALAVLFAAPWARYIPTASLAGLLLLAAFRMVDWRRLLFHLRATRFDAGLVLFTALSAVFISVEFCIVIGVFLSFVLYVPRAAKVRLVRLTRSGWSHARELVPGDPVCGKLLVYGLEGELFFGAEPEMEAHLEAIAREARAESAQAVVLSLKRGRNPDAAFLHLLAGLVESLQQQGATLLLCGVAPPLRRSLAETGLELALGAGQVFDLVPGPAPSVQEALERAYQILGEQMCASCPRRPENAQPAETAEYVI
jgi:SulP family sulfate permease